MIFASFLTHSQACYFFNHLMDANDNDLTSLNIHI